jgi:hypothetical protein
MGTLSTLSPVRATGSLRGILGGLARAITPVRRSARKAATVPHRPLEAMLEEADFSYGGRRQGSASLEATACWRMVCCLL